MLFIFLIIFSKTKALSQQSQQIKDSLDFTSTIRFNNRIYTKYYTGVYDDCLFMNFEYKNFMRFHSPIVQNYLTSSAINRSIVNINGKDDSFDENELCKKCEGTSLDESESQTLRKIDLPMKFQKLDGIFANLPVNVLDEEPVMMHKSENHIEEYNDDNKASAAFNFLKRQEKSLTLLGASVFSQMNQPPKTKTLRRSKAKVILPVSSTPQEQTTSATPSQKPKTESKLTSTGKKRKFSTAISSVKSEHFTENHTEEGLRTPPRAKKRLKAQYQLSAAKSSLTPSRTILHYFSSKQPTE